MLITLKERVVVRDSDYTSKSYNQILKAYSKTLDSYISNVIPSVGDIICVKKPEDNTSMYYDVISIIHYYNDAIYKYDDDIHTISKHSYSVYVEVKEHINTHTYQDNGYVFDENWPLITELKDISEK